MSVRGNGGDKKKGERRPGHKNLALASNQLYTQDRRTLQSYAPSVYRLLMRGEGEGEGEGESEIKSYI